MTKMATIQFDSALISKLKSLNCKWSESNGLVVISPGFSQKSLTKATTKDGKRIAKLVRMFHKDVDVLVNHDKIFGVQIIVSKSVI